MNQDHTKHLEQMIKSAKQAKWTTGVIMLCEGVCFSFFLGMTILAMREKDSVSAALCAIPTSVGAIGAVRSFNLFRDLHRDIERMKQEQKNQKVK